MLVLHLLIGCTEPVLFAPVDRSSGETPSRDSALPEDTQAPEEEAPHGMRLVPAGTALLGCTDGQYDCDEREGVYSVTLTSDLWLASHELTRGEWQAVMGVDPMPTPTCDDCPVGMVSWHQVGVFLNTLSRSEGLDECYLCEDWEMPTCLANVDQLGNFQSPYACNGYRLPTEAEWEIAARCGEDTTYAGSADPDLVAWVQENATGPHPVMEKAPNACGLYDMSGNVFEWNHDWYVEDLAGSELVDPLGPSLGTDRNARGGAWDFAARTARISYRDRCRLPEMAFENLGFRIARTAME